MLITSCSHCASRFRVSPQQLNERQGQVRCGRCHQVFNGFESLERFPDDDTGARLLAARGDGTPADLSLEDPPTTEPAPENDLPEIESVDAAPPPEIPRPVPVGAGALASAAPIPPALVAPGTAAATPDPTPLRPAVRHDLRGRELHLEAPAPRRAPSRAWTFGVVLMLLVLGVEAAYALRGPLAQRYPALRPTLESACSRLQCSVPWAHDEALLKLEESEMLQVPGKPSEIALGARIRNLASVAQEYPHLELTLSDFTGQPATRRVLRPTDYLGRPLTAGDVMPPGADIAIQLRLETPRIKPTGYELLLFYP